VQIARTLLVAIVCVGFTPGLGELISDSVHLLRSGHSHHGEHSRRAHVDDGHHHGHDGRGDAREHGADADDREHGHGSQPEHGCSGTQHSCPCHSSLTIAPVIVHAEVPGAELIAVGVSLPVAVQGPAGVHSQLDRPPRA
jgi:hypothetical protein